LEKEVLGPNFPSEWLLTADDGGGMVFTQNGDGDIAFVVEPEATFTLTEDGPAGYTQIGDWDCDVGVFEAPNKITLSINQDATCTISNAVIAPKLTLVKEVINDNGGSAGASAWTLTATGDGGFSGSGTPNVGNTIATNGPNPVKANVEYSLSESGPADYTNEGWVCTGDGIKGDNTIELAVAESAVCTITNDDNEPKLTLNKIVVNDNGGNTAESAWTLTATGAGTDPLTLTGLGAAGDADVVSGAGFDAGVYTLSETGDTTNYTASPWSCVNHSGFAAGVVTVGPNDTNVICTITNDDNEPKLTLNKIVVNPSKT